MMTDGEALYQAICAEPDDDAARLVYADYLDEQATTTICQHCNGTGRIPPIDDESDTCPYCQGNRYASDGNKERAEFIRVQIDLHRCGPEHRRVWMYEGAGVSVTKHGDDHYSFSSDAGETWSPGERVDVLVYRGKKPARWMRGPKVIKTIPIDESIQDVIVRRDDQSGPWKGEALKKRSQELLSRHWQEWTPSIDGLRLVPISLVSKTNATFRRGFVDEIILDASDFLKYERALIWRNGMTDHPCPECGGRRMNVAVVREGAIRETAAGICPRCSGTGRVSRPCPPSAQPITVVRFTDYDPGRPSTIYSQIGMHIEEHREQESTWYAYPKWPGIKFYPPSTEVARG